MVSKSSLRGISPSPLYSTNFQVSWLHEHKRNSCPDTAMSRKKLNTYPKELPCTEHAGNGAPPPPPLGFSVLPISQTSGGFGTQKAPATTTSSPKVAGRAASEAEQSPIRSFRRENKQVLFDSKKEKMFKDMDHPE